MCLTNNNEHAQGLCQDQMCYSESPKVTTCEVQYVLHLDDCSHPLYVHLNVWIQISEKGVLLSSGIEPGSAAYKAPDIPMCQIAPL